MRLKIDRPLVSIDFETTSLDVNAARIVQIGIKRILPNGCSDVWSSLVNPQMPISKEATEKHGITDEMVKDAPTFAKLAKTVLEMLGGSDIAGYNILSFDMPLLYNEFLRVGIVWDYHNTRFVDSCNIARRKESRNLEWALDFYCNQKLDNAHHAMADADAAADVLLAQVERYADIGDDVAALALYSNYDKPLLDFSGKFKTNADGFIVFNFGGHKDEPIENYCDYLEWMLRSDFAADTKEVIKKYLGIE